MREPVTWPDSVDNVIAGDQAVVLAYPTPLGGAVLTPVTNFATRDRQRGVITVNSSIGAWRKLDRIRRNPKVALAFHTRAHSSSNRTNYVLVQGTARLSPPIDNYPDSIGEAWEHFDGPQPGGLWKRWLRIYYTRVAIDISVERISTWPDLDCRGAPDIQGTPLPSDEPAPQRTPAGGREPRVDHRRAAARLAQLPDTLLGWLDHHGHPVVVPVTIGTATSTGVGLDAGNVQPPVGGRRAGLTGHSFTRYVTGQNQRVHTGWLDVSESGNATYAPHTERGHRLPPSPLAYRLAVGAMTRSQVRQARRSGLLDELVKATPCRHN